VAEANPTWSFAAASAAQGRLDQLTARVLNAVGRQMAGAPADLGVLFATNHFEDELEDVAGQIRAAARVGTLIGCTAEGVIGPEHEHENEPALSLFLARLPGTTVSGFHAGEEAIEKATTPEDWLGLFKVRPETRPNFLIFGDPYTLDVNTLFQGMAGFAPGCPISGGMASGAEAAGQVALVLNEEVYRDGAVGVALDGGVRLTTVVSQGCRPVGRPYVITRGERNIIHQLGGKKPFDVLRQTFEEASEVDQKLMQEGVLLGRVIDERKPEFRRGDFLVRNLIGADEDTGAIAVGDYVRTGTTVQFHVRDAATADEDLHALLAPYAQPAPAGALLFSCNGRGTRLYPDRDHDLKVVRQTLGPVPVAGFFCAGELGPVGGRNFIHGHTASLVLFHRP
jgi:small ligand-binding sensory domain FIST